MSDFQPPTDRPPPASPPAYSPPGGPPAGQDQGQQYLAVPVGQVPPRLGGAYYSPGLVILLTIVTLGIWGALWSYRTSEDLKRYNGDGLGGVLGVVVYILLHVVLMFTIPSEIQKMYERDGRQSPVTPVWGLWFLLPIIGNIVWYLKVQSSLNDFWLSKGAQPG
ncbi:MAG: DUF4234 domain-containing protein [Ilumatobacteraceae bacterium]